MSRLYSNAEGKAGVANRPIDLVCPAARVLKCALPADFPVA